MTRAEQLYQVIPAVYRNRDEDGDLKAYLEACGVLLDQFHATLRQRMADNFPDTPEDGSAACQDWLVPYFAELLDVRLVSPLPDGRRAEVSNAVSWRQGKGTAQVVEAIAEAVAQLEAVLQEGWQRVATTPRLDLPLLPARSFGSSGSVQGEFPGLAARHPGLPAVTVDLRCPSAAVATDAANPAGQFSQVEGATHRWRQAGRHGAPCYPGSYEDQSRRTVDLRPGDWRVGHYHPRKVLLYTVPPAGFFPTTLPAVNWQDEPGAAFLQHIEVIREGRRTTYRNRSLDSGDFQPVRVLQVIELGQTAIGIGDPDAHTWRFEGLVLDNTVELDSGRIELWRCAARFVDVHSTDLETPVIDARSCLFEALRAARGRVRLDYCTVLGDTVSEVIQASDSLFLGGIRKDIPSPPAPRMNCLRYSRVRPDQDLGPWSAHQLTTRAPVMFSTTFGERSCGVLHPASPAAVRHGAEDGGELGVFHDQHLGLLAEAVIDKLRDYLPVGQTAVSIPDPRLVEIPG